MKRKIVYILLVVLLLMAVSVFAVACSNKETVSVTFNIDGEQYAALSGKAGDSYDKPAEPTRDGYVFDGWYSDADFNNAATLPDVIPSKDAVFYGRWTQIPTVQYTVQLMLQKLNADETEAVDEYETVETKYTAEVGETVELGLYALAPEHFRPSSKTHSDQVISQKVDGEGVVFKAYFDRVTYVVSFDKGADAATGELEELRLPYGANIGKFRDRFDSSAFSYAGHVFGEWVVDNSRGEAEIFMLDRTISENYDVYVSWDEAIAQRGGDDIIYLHSMSRPFDLGGVYRYVNGVRQNGRYSPDTITGAFIDFDFTYDVDDVPVTDQGRIYADENETYFVYIGEENGMYFLKDQKYDNTFDVGSVLYLDGYGLAQTAQYDPLAGQIYFGEEYGRYVFNNEYNDFTYTPVNVQSQEEIDPDSFNFLLLNVLPEGTQAAEGVNLKGSYLRQGYESGTHLEYVVRGGEVDETVALELNGYGYARLIYIDPMTNAESQRIEGVYRATSEYVDEEGEWQFIPDDPADFDNLESMKFVLTRTNMDDGARIGLFVRYDEQLDCVLSGADGSVLILSGYYTAQYSPVGEDALYGIFNLLGDSNIVFYIDGSASQRVLFDVDFVQSGAYDGTFKINDTGYLIDNGVLIGMLEGIDMPVVAVLPDSVTEIGEMALRYNVETGVGLHSVTIPASVVKIGALAFENNTTLSRAIFLGETPPEIESWDAAQDPFRWPRADFVIIVPESALDAYKTAWSGCKYTITTLEELNDRPEWVIDENGILTQYNPKSDNKNIVLPDEVKAVGDRVFYGMDIVSIDFNNATSVGTRALYMCYDLSTVIATNLTEIGAEAFMACYSLTSVNLPAVKTVGEAAFANCTLLNDIRLGADIEYIGDEAFDYCGNEAATYLVLTLADGAGVPYLGMSAFYGIISYRVSVDTIESAVALYTAKTIGADGSSASNWARYLRPYVRECESSPLSGRWIDAETFILSEFSGRAELMGDTVALFRQTDAAHVLFYILSDGEVFEYTADYVDGVIKLSLNTTTEVVNITLIRADAAVTYSATDGAKLTFDFVHMTVADGIIEEIPATFVDAANVSRSVTVRVVGRRLSFKLDGDYDVNVTVQADMTFDYTLSANFFKGIYRAANGSYISLWFMGQMIYPYGSIIELVGQNGQPIVTSQYSMTWLVVEHSGNEYKFVASVLNDRYIVDIVVNDDDMSFEYTYALNSMQRAYAGSSGTVVLTLDASGKVVQGAVLMMVISEGSLAEQVSSTYTIVEDDGDGNYVIEFTVAYSDEIPENMVGTYRATLTAVKTATGETLYSCQVLKTA